MELTPIASSCVNAVGYDEIMGLMVVDFIETGRYTYFGVSPALFGRFMASASKGAFINLVFKQSNWEYIKGEVPEAIITAPLE